MEPTSRRQFIARGAQLAAVAAGAAVVGAAVGRDRAASPPPPAPAPAPTPTPATGPKPRRKLLDIGPGA